MSKKLRTLTGKQIEKMDKLEFFLEDSDDDIIDEDDTDSEDELFE